MKSQQKTLIGCLDLVNHLQKHKDQLKNIEKSSSLPKQQTMRAKFLTQWSDQKEFNIKQIHQVKSQNIYQQNKKLIKRLFAVNSTLPICEKINHKSNSEINRRKEEKRISGENEKLKSKLKLATTEASLYSQQNIKKVYSPLRINSLKKEGKMDGIKNSICSEGLKMKRAQYLLRRKIKELKKKQKKINFYFDRKMFLPKSDV